MVANAPRNRRGLWIRAAIYGPLILYFGWGALQKWRAEQVARERAAAPGGPPADPFAGLEGVKTESIILPDGSTMPVYLISPERAHELGLVRSEPSPGDEPEPPAELEPSTEPPAPAPEAAPSPEPSPDAAAQRAP